MLIFESCSVARAGIKALEPLSTLSLRRTLQNNCPAVGGLQKKGSRPARAMLRRFGLHGFLFNGLRHIRTASSNALPTAGRCGRRFAQAAQLSLAAAPRRCSDQTPNPRNEADSPNKEPSEKFRINVLHALRLKVFFCQ